MFRRKKKHNLIPEHEMVKEIQKSENQKQESAKEIDKARETVSILNRIREENHIVIDLREVFGGR